MVANVFVITPGLAAVSVIDYLRSRWKELMVVPLNNRPALFYPTFWNPKLPGLMWRVSCLSRC